MKKFSLLLSGLFLAISLNAQQLFIEGFSGYNLTNYDIEGFESKNGYVPLGFRIAGGLEHVQIGAEYQKSMTEVSAENTVDGAGIKTDISNEYYGGFIRANFSSLPAYRFGLVVKAGAGMYKSEHKNFVLPGDELNATTNYDPQLGFNAGIGFSSPIYANVHWEMGYVFNYVKFDNLSGGNGGYEGFYHSLQAGVSINLVFGNVAKACKSVIKTDRHGRSKRIH